MHILYVPRYNAVPKGSDYTTTAAAYRHHDSSVRKNIKYNTANAYTKEYTQLLGTAVAAKSLQIPI